MPVCFAPGHFETTTAAFSLTH